jgi:hypothetical protein
MSGSIAPPSLASTLAGGEWSDSCPGRLTPGKEAPRTHCTEGWVCLSAGLERCAEEKNLLPLPGIETPGRPARSPPLYRLSYPVIYDVCTQRGEAVSVIYHLLSFLTQHRFAGPPKCEWIPFIYIHKSLGQLYYTILEECWIKLRIPVRLRTVTFAEHLFTRDMQAEPRTLAESRQHAIHPPCGSTTCGRKR